MAEIKKDCLYEIILEAELSARQFYLHTTMFPVLSRHSMMNTFELEGFAKLLADREHSDKCWPKLLTLYSYALESE